MIITIYNVISIFLIFVSILNHHDLLVHWWLLIESFFVLYLTYSINEGAINFKNETEEFKNIIKSICIKAYKLRLINSVLSYTVSTVLSIFMMKDYSISLVLFIVGSYTVLSAIKANKDVKGYLNE